MYLCMYVCMYLSILIHRCSFDSIQNFNILGNDFCTHLLTVFLFFYFIYFLFNNVPVVTCRFWDLFLFWGVMFYGENVFRPDIIVMADWALKYYLYKLSTFLSSSHLPTYLPTYLPIYQPTYNLPTYLPISLSIYLSVCPDSPWAQRKVKLATSSARCGSNAACDTCPWPSSTCALKGQGRRPDCSPLCRCSLLLGLCCSSGWHGNACSVQCCLTSTETVRTIRDREPRTSTLTFTQLLSSDNNACSGQCCLTSIQTIGTIRDWEPGTAISTFTQLLSSDKLLRKVELDSQESPGEIKSREVELDSQENPGEIKRRA